MSALGPSGALAGASRWYTVLGWEGRGWGTERCSLQTLPHITNRTLTAYQWRNGNLCHN